MPPSVWTLEKLNQLNALIYKDTLQLTLNEAAKALGTTRAILSWQLSKMNVRTLSKGTFQWTPDRKALLDGMRDSNGILQKPLPEAAAILGCSYETLLSVLNEGAVLSNILQTVPLPTPDPKPQRLLERIPAPEAVKWLLPVFKERSYHLDAAHVAAVLSSQPAVTYFDRHAFREREAQLAALYGPSNRKAFLMAVRAPALFTTPLPVLKRTIDVAATLLGADRSHVLSIMRGSPTIACIPSGKLRLRFKTLSAAFKESPENVQAIILSLPSLLLVTAGDIKLRKTRLISLLRLDHERLAIGLRRNPAFLKLDPDDLANRIRSFATLIKMAPTALADVFIKNPALLQLKPETVSLKITAVAAALHCSEAALVAAFLRDPKLLVLSPGTVRARLAVLAFLFGKPSDDMATHILSNPRLLIHKSDDLTDKATLLVQLSELLGSPETIQSIMHKIPNAFTYSRERILGRIALAKAGINTTNISNLLSMSDAKAAALSR